MRTIQVFKFGGPEELTMTDQPRPEPTESEILVKLHAAGVNPVDTYLRAGSNPALPLPYTPGMDGAGVIEEVGPKVKGFKPGQRVYTATFGGAYAEYIICKPTELFPLPDNLTFEQGASVHINYASAYRAIFQKGNAQPGETILIHGGSGGVGIAAIQLAKAAGLQVIATAGTAEGRSLVLEQGADYALDHTSESYLDAAKEVTNGTGFDLIIEMLANVNLAKDLTILKAGGKVIIVGSRGKVEITPRDLMAKESSIVGMLLLTLGHHEIWKIHQAISAGLRSGVLKPVVGKIFPLEQASKAHEVIINERAYGKIVLKL